MCLAASRKPRTIYGTQKPVSELAPDGVLSRNRGIGAGFALSEIPKVLNLRLNQVLSFLVERSETENPADWAKPNSAYAQSELCSRHSFLARAPNRVSRALRALDDCEVALSRDSLDSRFADKPLRKNDSRVIQKLRSE
jgi:hypothetical protein